jgi:putative ABC transport system permease protein
MMIFKIVTQSALSRKFNVILSIGIIALSTLLFLGVDKIQKGAYTSFSQSISDTDIIVGAKSSPVNILLYSVFRMGSPTQNISWKSYEKWSNNSEVEWSIPISLGDSHKGFRVIGTNEDYFKHYKFGSKEKLSFNKGQPFNTLYQGVIGSEVAKTLKYEVGDSITITHGVADLQNQNHKGHYFKITGILSPTGTPVDRSIHIPLEGIEVIHRNPNEVHSDLTPTSITAIFVGLKSRISIFRLKRSIDNYKGEPLSAVLPGATLHQLWQTINVVDTALKLTSLFVVLVGLTSLLGMLWSNLEFRRREMMVLRAIGAHTKHLVLILLTETLFITLSGIIIGYSLLQFLLRLGNHTFSSKIGMRISIEWFSLFDLYTILGMIFGTLIITTILSFKLHRDSIQDGLIVKI